MSINSPELAVRRHGRMAHPDYPPTKSPAMPFKILSHPIGPQRSPMQTHELWSTFGHAVVHSVGNEGE